MRKLLLTISAFALLASCSDSDDKPNGIVIDRHGALDIKYTQQLLDTSVVITTRKDVYDNSGRLVVSKTTIDTLPSLGLMRDTLNTGRQNDDGDDVDTVFDHKKPYQFYITVKPQ